MPTIQSRYEVSRINQGMEFEKWEFIWSCRGFCVLLHDKPQNITK